MGAGIRGILGRLGKLRVQGDGRSRWCVTVPSTTFPYYYTVFSHSNSVKYIRNVVKLLKLCKLMGAPLMGAPPLGVAAGELVPSAAFPINMRGFLISY